ncbi:rhodanese-like domain-containing protein [Flammeovirga kamogawensis]|uniref:Rhodanese-like domain-containing protein n=1 Tax=Flammeovirga kamogawensis TaxID=373891 RepID=A0ABX8GUU2_9BACT|nr:rhodanese-like domain-containing protein [Flammeovirga kamogawensis]MBB6459858.1 adenylyltransferase/sulfurtransferase [Flammeovirga kamogawensis]QWG07088.1 rhodanese-like domain-containing protein [Flammeovirga kamogawensis]TRX68909.1 rhodanese-like domain-containing protein [Flammeovirga kamogawensis]
MKSITVEELKDLQDSGADFQLIDVREDYEFDEANLGGVLIPLATVIDEAEEKISKDKRVIIHCRSGKRSANAIAALEGMKGYTNLENLEGGILAYIDAFGLDD